MLPRTLLNRNLSLRNLLIRNFLLVLLVAPVFCGTAVQADIIKYTIPGLRLDGKPITVLLQGKATVNAGKTVTFRHPKFGVLYLGLTDCDITRTPTIQDLASQELAKAKRTGETDELMKAARYALRKGLLRQFYAAVDEVVKIDSQHQAASKIKALQRLFDEPLPVDKSQEEKLRKLVRKGGMKVRRSDHFLLFHDTSDIAPRKGKTRADERLELLEAVYESFLLRFYSQGMELDIPKKRMMVVLFARQSDYLEFATSMSPELSSTAGFWSGEINVSFFYDHGSSKSVQALSKMAAELQQMKTAALRRRDATTRDIVRMADTISLMVDIKRENSDIEVVSHEATHQVAGNTGLLPRHVMIPAWVHEGLATYFESPNDAAWSGIGAVNAQRLAFYRALENDRQHSNIDFIVGDQIFKYAGTHGAALHGYGQAWALTHFLMEQHFTDFMTYYRRLGEMPPDIILSPALLNKLFTQSFKTDRQTLDVQWRSYMSSLKTDVDQVLSRKR